MATPEQLQELIDRKVERALAPWADLLPPEALAEFREQLEDFLTTHPAMERMLAEIAPAPAVAVSGEVDAAGNPVSATPSKGTGTGGSK